MPDDTFKSARQPDSPIKFIGTPPPGMKQALKGVRQEKEQEAKIVKEGKEAGENVAKIIKEGKEAIVDVPPQIPSQARPVGSSDLEKLLEGLQPVSYVYDEIKLPSLGIFYDNKNGPSDGICHLRPMTGEEEQILATPRYVRKGHAIDLIFQRCMKEHFHTDSFLSQDRTYMLIFLRLISYGHEYAVEVKCPDCEKKFNTDIDLNQLSVNYCPPDFRPPLSDTLPKSNYKINYRLPRGKEENLIQEYRDKNLKMWGDSGTDESLIYRTAMLIDDIEGLKDKQELMILLKKLPIQDVAHIRNLTTEPPFGVDTRSEIICPRCLRDFEVDLPFEANFFFPRARHRKKEPESV